MAESKKKKAAPAKTVRPKRRPASRAKKKITQPRATKPRTAGAPVEPSTVRLVAGKGSYEQGGGPDGHYWHVYTGETRAGYVYINVIDEPPFGRHASIQIHVNQTLRGRGVGKVAYRLACEQSRHDVVIAHMRKNNVASQRAAAAAGFVVVNDPTITQLAMRWTRPSPTKPE